MERKRSALDWAAHIVEENGRELAESFLSAARNGDWRAAEALMNRIYGRPEQPLAVTRPEPSALQAFARSLSLDEKIEMLQRLKSGELAAPVPVVEHRTDAGYVAVMDRASDDRSPSSLA